MGYYLLYESMLDCVLWARDKYLNKKTGKMLPVEHKEISAKYKYSMADKRAYCRAMTKLLGMFGVYGEDESPAFRRSASSANLDY